MGRNGWLITIKARSNKVSSNVWQPNGVIAVHPNVCVLHEGLEERNLKSPNTKQRKELERWITLTYSLIRTYHINISKYHTLSYKYICFCVKKYLKCLLRWKYHISWFQCYIAFCMHVSKLLYCLQGGKRTRVILKVLWASILTCNIFQKYIYWIFWVKELNI